MAVKSVLFLCTGNSIRSQMAEGYLRSMGSEDIEIQSAGITAAGIHPMTIKILREDSVDVSGQWSKSIDEIRLNKVDYVVTLCDHAQSVCPPLPKKVKSEHWSIDDPISFSGSPEERIKKFQVVRNEIRTRVRDLLERLRRE